MPEEKKEGLISRLINSKDPTRDMKLAAFGLIVLASVCWLSREMHSGPITDQWVNAFKWLLLSVSLGGAGWSAVDKWRGGKGDTPEGGAQ